MRNITPPEILFWRHVEVGDCWQWTAFLNKDGYPLFGIGPRRSELAYRWLWKHLVDPDLESTTQLDHLCKNRGCVNPDHLEPVTKAENNARRMYSNSVACKRGHLYEGNTYFRPSGGRECASCRRDRAKART